jgi:transcriptional regulator with XRE-family HTH domain
MRKTISPKNSGRPKALPLQVREQIKTARHTFRLSQDHLCRITKQTQGQLSGIETGKTDPRFSTLLGICRALNLEPILVPRDHVEDIQLYAEALQEGPEQGTYSGKEFTDENE